MRTLYLLGIVAGAVVILFLIYSPLAFLYIIGGMICTAIVIIYTIPKTDDDRERQEPLFPSTHRGPLVSSAWLGAKMDEEEARRKEAQKDLRDQGH